VKTLVQLHIIDWIVIGLYLLLVFGVSVFFVRRANLSMSEYFLSGRSLPWWLVGVSMVATTFAADTPLAVTGFIRKEGIWYNWFGWHFIFSQMLAVVVFSKLWRRSGVLTDNELIELRYDGKPAAFLRGLKAVLFAVVYNFIVMGWVLKALGTIGVTLFVDRAGLEAALGPAAAAARIDAIETWIIWVGALLVGVYCLISGYWGVVVTDLFQFMLAMIGSICLATLMVAHFGGMGEMLTAARAAPLFKPDTLAFIPDLKLRAGESFLDSTFFKFSVFITIMWWSYHNSDGGGYIIQRMLSTKDERNASLSMMLFMILNNAVRYWPWIVVAIGTLALFPDPAMTESAYPMAVGTLLGPGLLGIMVVSLAAAFMSTIDTHINWGSSYLVNDLYKRFIRADADERHYVNVSKLCTAGLIVLAALCATRLEEISDAWFLVWAMFSGIGPVLILRWFWWRINAWSEIAALAFSFAMAIVLECNAYLHLPPGTPYHLGQHAPVLFGVALETHHKALLIVPLAVLVWVTVTLLTRPVGREHLRAFCARVRPPGFWGACRVPGEAPSFRLGDVALVWVAGVLCTYCAIFGIGWAVLGEVWRGLAAIVASIGLGIFTVGRISRPS